MAHGPATRVPPGLPHLGTLRRTTVRLRSTRYDIPSHLHSYTPLLSSTQSEIERLGSRFPNSKEPSRIVMTVDP
jgi:hypothetical protein